MKDFDQQMKFWFENKYGDTTSSGQVNLESGADFLPNIFEAFEQFIRQAGFTYIELSTDGDSWTFSKTGGLSEFEPDIFEDADWDSEERQQDVRELYEGIYADEEDELAAYEAERSYDEEYYDPFTRDVDYSEFLADLPLEPAIAVGDKVRVISAAIGDSRYVFGREGIVKIVSSELYAPNGQTILADFPEPKIMTPTGVTTNLWWVNPDALEVIG
jgi:hypothetical protein